MDDLVYKRPMNKLRKHVVRVSGDGQPARVKDSFGRFNDAMDFAEKLKRSNPGLTVTVGGRKKWHLEVP